MIDTSTAATTSARGDGPSGTLAIVVSFNPELAQLKTLLANLSQQTPVLLLDNGSQNSAALAALAQSLAIECQLFEDNIGLAAALNKGLCYARERDYASVLLFDQDSACGDHYVSRVQTLYGELSEQDQTIAAIGPRLVDPLTARPTPFKCFTFPWFKKDKPYRGRDSVYEADFLITSGSFIPLSALGDIGPMEEAYFIDNIDMEWCFRARAKGYTLLGTDRVSLQHRIGEIDDSPLGRLGLIRKHRPLRSYYSTRNRFDLYRRPYAPLPWKFWDMIRFVVKTTILLLFNRQRGDYWRYIKAGLLGKPLPK